MSGYTEEFKLKIVKEHLKEGYSSYFLAKKYELHKSTVQEWIKQYETFGFFIPPIQHYTTEFKLKVLNYQQEHHLSDSRTAVFFGITNQGTICTWRKKYITGGTEALFQKQGRRSKMPKKSLIPNKPREEWTKDEELAYLRMENEYLKKLTALIQEDKQREKDSKNKKSESSKN